MKLDLSSKNLRDIKDLASKYFSDSTVPQVEKDLFLCQCYTKAVLDVVGKLTKDPIHVTLVDEGRILFAQDEE